MSTPPKYVDLLLLAAALAVFLLADLPLLGYAAGAVAWLAQRGIQMVAAQRTRQELLAGNRQKAMGIVAATTLGRVWLMATAVLVVGLLGQREDGLAPGVQLPALINGTFAAQVLTHLFGEPEGQGA